MNLNLEELREVVLNSQEAEELYKTFMVLCDKVNKCFAMLNEGTESDLTKLIRTDLSVYKDLKAICKVRMEDARNTSFQFNKKFRLVAKEKLSEEMYRTISREANTDNKPVTNSPFKN